MSSSRFQALKINGKLYEGDDLKLICQEKLNETSIPSWEKSIYKFIRTLTDESNHISVKTSGSTGKPKTIKLSKDLLIQSAKATKTFLGLKKGMNVLLCLPVDYIAGKMMIVRAFVSGLNLIYSEPGGNPLKGIDLHLNFVAMVPLQVANSLNDENEKIKKIEKLIIGGGTIDQRLQKKLKNFPNKIYATYGMTETATHIALKKLNSSRTDEHYQCLPGISVRENEEQCLIIKAPYISKQEIATNDIARIFSENEFEIIGRKDNIINSGGIKIIPEEIEAKISAFIDQNFFITSLADEKLGEKVILLIENGKTNLNLLYNTWKELEKRLSKYEMPKIIDFMDAFKYTKSGKIHRSLTKKSYLESL